MEDNKQSQPEDVNHKLSDRDILKIIIVMTVVFCMVVVAFNVYIHRIVPIPTVEVIQNSSQVVLSEDLQDYLITEKLSINLNTATREDLMQISGIGEVLADNIVTYRETHGEFTQISQLLSVDRIGEATLEKIKPYLYLS